jgi:SPP1 gp7 family putative phage head morphogenesis protein
VKTQIEAAIAVRKALGVYRRRKRSKPPRMISPLTIEREYAKRLLSIVSEVRTVFAPVFDSIRVILPLVAADRSRVLDSAIPLPALIGDYRTYLRSDSDYAKRMQILIDQSKKQLKPRNLEELARAFAQRADDHNRTQVRAQVKAATGVDVFTREPNLKPIFDTFAQRNVTLVEDLTNNAANRLQNSVMRAIQLAQTNEQLAEQITKDLKTDDDRALKIARDQIGSLYGQINATRQQTLGITKFIWRTSHDERVRSEHEELDGQEFEYTDPPGEGLPGEPIMCRCYAEPVIDLDNL